MHPDPPDDLERAFAVATPAARFRAIRQRLASQHGETGTTRLVTMVAAVEALSRSLVVHSFGRPAHTAAMRHRQFRDTGPLELVQEVLRLRGAPLAAESFAEGAWEQFGIAVRLRDLVVHECTSVAPDRVAPVLAASEAILRGLVELSGLEGGPRTVG
jgi:hypothetical protein